MTSRDYDIVVAGAGPAGLAAACRAAESGKRVAILDDNPQPGGQIWRADARKGPDRARSRWLRLAIERKVEIITGARVFGVPRPGVIAVETGSADFEIGYRALVLATGARERFLPFPGWTLPNVMGAGGLQALVKGGLPVEGRKIVVAGSGPLLLAVAKYLRGRGADVRLIAEQAERSALVRFGCALAPHPGKLGQAIRLRAALIGVPYLTACWPVEAHGAGKLESVTLRRAGKSWRESCDYLACGFGLIPNTELAELLGCGISRDGVEVDDYQETSVAEVYCAGEATGVGGLDLALIEGEIAGYAASGRRDQARARFGVRERSRRFAALLNRAFALRDELKRLPDDQTLVCRCEDVSYGRLRRCSGWREAKLQTRCGMGPCQGRICGGALEFLLGWRPESVRPPLFPVKVKSLAQM